MGWFRDDPAHEGYVVGLVEEEVEFIYPNLPRRQPHHSKHLRELTYSRDHDREVPEGGLRVATFQVACECGWRSPRFVAPFRARWLPYSLELGDEGLEDAARELWGAHYDDEQQGAAKGLTRSK
jgi:hypothetical protein